MFLSICFVRQIRLPRKAGEANLPPELLATHLGYVTCYLLRFIRLPRRNCIISLDSAFRVGFSSRLFKSKKIEKDQKRNNATQEDDKTR